MSELSDRNLEGHLADVLAAPRDGGRVEMIVRRPGVDEREVLVEGVLDPVEGLVGDDWVLRGSRSTPDGRSDPNGQLTLMSTRVLAAIEPDRTRWPLAGDQICLDMDLGATNLPTGTKLRIGSAMVQITAKRHTGCAKFAARFGADALAWVNAPAWAEHRLRGVYVRILERGVAKPGDAVTKA